MNKNQIQLTLGSLFDGIAGFPLAAAGESVWQIAADMLRGIGRRIVYKVRRQTPTECERLDGFPDGWTKFDTKGNEISDTARYTALGNSIAIPCAVRVFQGIAAVEREVTQGDS